MARIVRMSDWEKIVLTGISRAKAGDLGWARFLAEYLIGTPVQKQEITGAEGEPFVPIFRVVNVIAPDEPVDD